MVQVKISQIMLAAGLAAAALVGFGGAAHAASPASTAPVACDNGDAVVVTVEVSGSYQSISPPVACDAPACAEGVLTTVVDDSGVQQQACVASAAAVSSGGRSFRPRVRQPPWPRPLSPRSHWAGASQQRRHRCPRPAAGTTGGLVIAALLVGSGSLASLLSRRRT